MHAVGTVRGRCRQAAPWAQPRWTSCGPYAAHKDAHRVAPTSPTDRPSEWFTDPRPLRGQQTTRLFNLEFFSRVSQATKYPLDPEADLNKIGVRGSKGIGGQYTGYRNRVRWCACPVSPCGR